LPGWKKGCRSKIGIRETAEGYFKKRKPIRKAIENWDDRRYGGRILEFLKVP